MKRKRGFTLMELLWTIGIFGLLLLITCGVACRAKREANLLHFHNDGRQNAVRELSNPAMVKDTSGLYDQAISKNGWKGGAVWKEEDLPEDYFEEYWK